ncbi:MAG TPA: hypothetical protein VEF34_12485 [Syntrophobacteraceae bacterium]|nr:hypothetical protein [Syntrophobacteraceae bacterium]
MSSNQLMMALVLIGLSLFVAPVKAHDIIESCIGGEVRLIDVSAEPLPMSPAGVKPETIEIIAKAEATKLIARGPVLGSMDSPEIKTDLSCTAKGFVLTATITRSADYHGAVLQNENWWPRITIAVVPRQCEIVFQTIWKMRLTDGSEVDHAKTPPLYLDRKYPITVTKKIYSACGQQQ